MSDATEGSHGQDDSEDHIPHLKKKSQLEDMFMNFDEMEAFVQEAEDRGNSESNMTSEEEDLDSMMEEEEMVGTRKSKRKSLLSNHVLLLRLRKYFWCYVPTLSSSSVVMSCRNTIS